jgi:hypothetical protein
VGNRLTKSQRSKVERAIHQHERHRNSWFWKPPFLAQRRREREISDSWDVSFKLAGNRYEYKSLVKCSAKNYYYTGSFFLNGEKRTVRLFKSLLAEKKKKIDDDDAEWEAHFAALIRFKKREGHCNVPYDHVEEANT